MTPKIASQGIEIKKWWSNPLKRGTEERPPGDKGKRKKHIARKDIIVEVRVAWSDNQDDHH